MPRLVRNISFISRNIYRSPSRQLAFSTFRTVRLRSTSAQTPAYLKPLNLAYMGDNVVNFYSGQPPLNRLSFQRQSPDKLNAHLNAPNARFILFRNLQPLIKKGSSNEWLFLSKKDIESHIGPDFKGPSPEDASSKERSRLFEAARLPSTLPAVVFLGIDDRADASADSKPMSEDPLNPRGVPYFAVEAPKGDWVPEGGEFGDARSVGSAMGGWEAGVFAQGRALVDWNTRNKFCAGCGSPTYSLWGGWKRSCTSALEPKEDEEACFSTKGLHNFAYPRTDSVVIMGILNEAGDKMLLGRQKSWPKGMYSCLAGFIEPGESFEDAVRREVLEEAGIVVGPVRYSSSQPWPYPANIMVGCFGQATDNQTIRFDLDNELEDAQWFPRSVLADLVGSKDGSFLSKADLKKLDDTSSGKAKMEDDKITAGALAPSEKKDGEVEEESKKGRQGMELTRVPPETAIAGMLIRTWLNGGVELASKL